MICPLLVKCNEQIPFDKYVNVCTNLNKNAYQECNRYKELTGGLKYPRNWRDVLST